MGKLFISHSSQDLVWCQQFVAALRAAGHTCFFDHDSIPGSSEWLDTIQNGVTECDLCVLVLSPVAWASPWVQREWKLALRHNKHILPVEHVATPDAFQGFLGQYQMVKAVGLDAATAAQRTLAELHRIGYGVGAVTAATPSAPSVVPPVQQVTSFPIPTRLARLGFQGRVIDKVEVIVPPLCDVPAGNFTMGSDKTHDWQAYDDEQPQYDIFVAAFQIAAYPVTVAEYAHYLTANPKVAVPPSSTYPKDAQWAAPEWRGKEQSWSVQQTRADHPVVMISWLDAVAYAQWVARVTGQPWRLPTEAEWEKAARSTDGRLCPWGNTWDMTLANTNDGGPKMTTPVGIYADKGDASPYGVHDMVGNVSEWTSSLYQEHPPYRVDTCENDGDRTSIRVLRGGSWRSVPSASSWGGLPRDARVARRDWNYPNKSIVDNGVRLARPSSGLAQS